MKTETKQFIIEQVSIVSISAIIGVIVGGVGIAAGGTAIGLSAATVSYVVINAGYYAGKKAVEAVSDIVECAYYSAIDYISPKLDKLGWL